MIMRGMAMNTLGWWATSTTIWERATSGWYASHSAWSVFMAGKEAIPIGMPMPSAIFSTEEMPEDMSIRGVMTEGTDVEFSASVD